MPLVGIALVAFFAGMIKGCPGHPHRDEAVKYIEAWQNSDYGAMYDMLSTKSKAGISLARFTQRYGLANAEATIESIEHDDAGGDETTVEVPMKVDTLAFGTVSQSLKVTFGSDGIAWQNNLLFPGLELGEELTRTTKLPTRAAILTDKGKPMAKGPVDAREHPLGDAMIDVTGVTGEPSDDGIDLESLALGYEPGETTGTSGLELAFNGRLTGTPGGTLYAKPIGSGSEGQGRELGSGDPSPAPPLKTTIDETLQNSAVTNLAGQSGGVAVLNARKGYIKALAGQAYSVLQPPGSTMKIVTATAALESGKATMDSSYDYVTEAPADGRMIKNAHDEVCGGTFVESFAHSCNSVFAPLAEQVGPEAFTGTAERYGFNRPPQVWDPDGLAAVDPPIPTVPKADDYDNDLGVSGIGQGRVQATPLLMASVAQAVSNKGVSLPTPITREPALQPEGDPVRVTSPKIASQVADLMVAVVTSGTGPAAAISEGQVAGKTGTAEVGPSGEVDENGDPINLEDAWFAGFAPSDKPKLVVCVMLINANADGGTVAAPIAGAILSDGL